MAEQQRTVKLGERNGYLMTTFRPPIHEGRLWEATTGAFVIKEIVRDRDNDRKVRGIMYSAGDAADFDRNIAKLRAEIETNTGYSVANEVIRMGQVATEAVAQATPITR